MSNRDFVDNVEVELGRWAEAFDRVVATHDPDCRPGPCDACGRTALVYGLSAAITRTSDGPLLCRPCVITGGMRQRAA